MRRTFDLVGAYNRQEAAKRFEAALTEREDDFLPHWGIAYCHGADYNMGNVRGPETPAGWPNHRIAGHARRAVALSSGVAVACTALLKRYQAISEYVAALDALFQRRSDQSPSMPRGHAARTVAAVGSHDAGADAVERAYKPFSTVSPTVQLLYSGSPSQSALL